MSPGPTFDRVYAALKEQLLSGRWAPGAHLEPGVIGDDLGASTTPVRDALHRLVGERLIEAPRHDGFWVPTMSEAALRELYDWNGELLAMALRGLPLDPLLDIAREVATTDPAPLFLAIARQAGNAELERAVASNNDRLAAYRAIEPQVIDDCAGELASLHLCGQETNGGRLRRELAAYHKRRLRATPLVLAVRHRTVGRGLPR